MVGFMKQTQAELFDFVPRRSSVSETISTTKRNQNNLSELIEIQEKTGEACFFVGLYGLSTAILPEKSLPDAHEYLALIRSKYSYLLEDHSLNINYSNIDSALKIYEEWGINLKRLSMNKAGRSIIGRHLKDKTVATCSVVPTWNSLDLSQTSTPYSILLHQAGCNNSHFITIDGSGNANSLKEKYINEDYKTIALFEFSPNLSF